LPVLDKDLTSHVTINEQGTVVEIDKGK